MLFAVLGLILVVTTGRGAYSAVDVGLVLLREERYKTDPDPLFNKIDNSFRASVKPGSKVYTPQGFDDPWRAHLIEIFVLRRTYLVNDAADADWIVWVVQSTSAAGVVDVHLETRRVP